MKTYYLYIHFNAINNLSDVDSLHLKGQKKTVKPVYTEPFLTVEFVRLIQVFSLHRFKMHLYKTDIKDVKKVSGLKTNRMVRQSH